MRTPLLALPLWPRFSPDATTPQIQGARCAEYSLDAAKLTLAGGWIWTILPRTNEAFSRNGKVTAMNREVLRKTLLDILKQESWIETDNLTDDVNLRTDLKLDSVDLLSMALQAERTLGISIDSQDFEQVNTLGDLLSLLQAKLSSKPSAAAA